MAYVPKMVVMIVAEIFRICLIVFHLIFIKLIIS